MAGTLGNQNAVGNSGGKTLQDRKLAAEVRTLTLQKIKALFEKPRVDMTALDAALHDQILIKLAGTVLPRLNEHTGADGEQLFPKPLLDVLHNGGNPEDSQAF